MSAPEVPVPTLIEKSVLIETDAVRILDRRVFPLQKTWVTCRTYEEVATAIEEMVTQSSGPLFAAAGGMVLAARSVDTLSGVNKRREAFKAAADRLLATRPTNNGIREAVGAIRQAAEPLLAANEQLSEVVEWVAQEVGQRYLGRSRLLGENAGALLEDGDTILTHCWAESYLTETLAFAIRAGKQLNVVCTETRPYLQGARLTAESLAEMGIPTSVISDGMPAELMSRGAITKVVTAADRVTMDGHVINKVGTLQIAIAAHAFGIPYVALVQAPDAQAATVQDVPMEYRDGNEVLYLNGQRTASNRVTGIYPAFDITPPRFISVIATDRGRYSPSDLSSYYTTKGEPVHDTVATSPESRSALIY
nr:s-methyl-5-thioribose-1-phosphate isomerase [Arthrobacter castelli]